MNKFFIEESRGNKVGEGRTTTWKVFVNERIPVGMIFYQPSHGWKDPNGDYSCQYYNTNDTYYDGSYRLNYAGKAKCVSDGKRFLEKYFKEHPERLDAIINHSKRKAEKVQAKFLPANEEFAKDFFPTPSALAGKMIGKVRNRKGIHFILEPSAGSGNLIESVKKSFGRDIDFDAIEADRNLQKILQSTENVKLVHDDFLTYKTNKHYDLIIMNPPFSFGAEHLLKAMDMQRKQGGQIVCLLNAETIRNPYSKVRRQLAFELDKLGSQNYSIEFVSNAFSKAERKTDVEIVIVYCNFSAPERSSFIFENMKKAELEKEEDYEKKELLSSNFIEGLVSLYNVESAAGVELINEYRAMAPYMMKSMTEKTFNRPILELKVDGHDCSINRYLKCVRLKYWQALFKNDEFTSALTSKVRDRFYSSVEEMAEYEFSLFNIKKVMSKMAAEMVSGVEETILALFEELSAEHAYYPECKKNIWYFSGWKTNKAHKVNNKCIVPCYGIYTDRSWSKDAFDIYNAYKFLADIEKCLNYLDGQMTVGVDLERTLKHAASCGITRNIHCKYFDVTFYKKGTCHITFTNQYVLDALNIFAARHKNWLPPSYGRVKYNDMNSEDQKIVDEFQGKEKYDEVMKNQQLYLYDGTSSIALLGSRAG